MLRYIIHRLLLMIPTLIGVAVLVFLWGSSDGFGSPPLFFKVFGSLIALAFMAMGFGVPFHFLRRGKEMERLGAHGLHPQAAPPASLQCPNCGANVGKAEVSPGGDVKCIYCHGWWNIHRR